MRRLLSLLGLVLLVPLAAPPAASAQQSFSVYFGAFSPRGLDARSDTDVLVADLFNGDYSLDFGVDDFQGGTIGAEWLVGLGSHVDVGVGIGYYRKTVPSIYAFLLEDDFSDIEQDLRLRIVPFTATVRFLPLGREAPIQPYIGAGVGVFNWRYSEVGEFVDTGEFAGDFDDFVFQDRFIDSGTTAGPVILGGLRFPVGAWDIGGEVRFQRAEGELEPFEFLGDTIDLGGVSYLMTVNVRF